MGELRQRTDHQCRHRISVAARVRQESWDRIRVNKTIVLFIVLMLSSSGNCMEIGQINISISCLVIFSIFQLVLCIHTIVYLYVRADCEPLQSGWSREQCSCWQCRRGKCITGISQKNRKSMFIPMIPCIFIIVTRLYIYCLLVNLAAFQVCWTCLNESYSIENTLKKYL